MSNNGSASGSEGGGSIGGTAKPTSAMNQTNTDSARGILCTFREKYMDNLLECVRDSPHVKSLHFEPIYSAIEKYVINANLIISNEPTESARHYRVYGARIFFHANALANLLAEITPYVRLNTIVREKEFDIQIDGARIVYFHNIDPSFARIISPQKKQQDGQTKRSDPHILPAEVALVDVYHRLYSPDAHKTWNAIRKYESLLWESFKKTRMQITARAHERPVDAKRRPSTNELREQDAASEARASEKIINVGGAESEYLNAVLAWLKSMRDYVIVGNYALTCMNGAKCPMTGAIQIIVGNPKSAIDALSKELSKYHGNIRVDMRKYDLQLPTDHRIKKYVLSARIGQTTYYIANLFNCASYELIPFISIAGMQIGALEVILRFLFIDLWFIRLIHGFEKMSDAEYAKNVRMVFNNVDDIRARWITAPQITAPPSYIGSYISETVSKKTVEMVPPYFPAQFIRENGSYRTIKGLDVHKE